MNKRKTAIDLTDLAIGILMLGIIVVIGSRILLAQRDNRLTSLDTIQNVNETTGAMNETGTNLAATWVKSVDACYNITGFELLATDLYTATVSEVNGVATITVGSNSTLNNSQINCTYTTWDTTRPDWALPNDAAVGISEFGNWFDIIVIVGIAGLILSLIFLAFGRRGEEATGVSY